MNSFAKGENLYYNKNMELEQVANYLNGKFLINNYKKDKKELVKGPLLASYSTDKLGTSICEVNFYDTSDFFFANKGISIYTETTKMSSQLIIRYDNAHHNRIEFLKNIPNFFKLQITKGSSIQSHAEKISEAIYQVFPTGLGINIEEYLRTSFPVIKISKKRESYRVVNNVGLKMILNFETCEYYNAVTKNKFSQPVLDVFGETQKTEDFDLFLKHLVRDHPQLIKLPDNELEMVRSNT